MPIREATLIDIPQLHYIRMSVKENVLSDPNLIKEEDYVSFLTEKGKGWLFEMNGITSGFAIVDLEGRNVWALFIHPDHEKNGIGKQLHDIMLDWYFSLTDETIWLSTSPGTRAETFYRKAEWTETGYTNGELKFEMTVEGWEQRSV